MISSTISSKDPRNSRFNRRILAALVVKVRLQWEIGFDKVLNGVQSTLKVLRIFRS